MGSLRQELIDSTAPMMIQDSELVGEEEKPGAKEAREVAT
jgi:hypothetical protein